MVRKRKYNFELIGQLARDNPNVTFVKLAKTYTELTGQRITPGAFSLIVRRKAAALEIELDKRREGINSRNHDLALIASILAEDPQRLHNAAEVARIYAERTPPDAPALSSGYARSIIRRQGDALLAQGQEVKRRREEAMRRHAHRPRQ